MRKINVARNLSVNAKVDQHFFFNKRITIFMGFRQKAGNRPLTFRI